MDVSRPRVDASMARARGVEDSPPRARERAEAHRFAVVARAWRRRTAEIRVEREAKRRHFARCAFRKMAMAWSAWREMTLEIRPVRRRLRRYAASMRAGHFETVFARANMANTASARSGGDAKSRRTIKPLGGGAFPSSPPPPARARRGSSNTRRANRDTNRRRNDWGGYGPPPLARRWWTRGSRGVENDAEAEARRTSISKTGRAPSRRRAISRRRALSRWRALSRLPRLGGGNHHPAERRRRRFLRAIVPGRGVPEDADRGDEHLDREPRRSSQAQARAQPRGTRRPPPSSTASSPGFVSARSSPASAHIPVYVPPRYAPPNGDERKRARKRKRRRGRAAGGFVSAASGRPPARARVGASRSLHNDLRLEGDVDAARAPRFGSDDSPERPQTGAGTGRPGDEPASSRGDVSGILDRLRRASSRASEDGGAGVRVTWSPVGTPT